MNRTFFVSLGLTLLLVGGACLARPASADVITFDDLDTRAADNTHPGWVKMPSDYEGFTWDTSWSAVDTTYYQSVYDNTYGAVSGDVMAYNGGGVLEVTLSGGVFDFAGMHVTGWAAHDAAWAYNATSITVEGYRDGVLQGTVTANLSTSEFDWLSVGFEGVDELHFESSGSSKWWLMDDFTYTPVPEPATLVLLGTGLLLGLGLRRRRRRRAA